MSAEDSPPPGQEDPQVFEEPEIGDAIAPPEHRPRHPSDTSLVSRDAHDYNLREPSMGGRETHDYSLRERNIRERPGRGGDERRSERRERQVRELAPDSPSPPPPVHMKVKKKPGPKPTHHPPLTKNDIQTKKSIIREIQGHWGPNFIKNYIPKVHRPLTKKRKGIGRASRRAEDNPLKWSPSVLKSILMIARITDDKAKLKKTMGDVVRYRNQHTGNKKPQLVTTDFDIIEDVLEHDWDIPKSFRIRYKHLLMGRLDGGPTDTKELDDYYKHLFRSDSETGSGDEMDDDDQSDDNMDHELTNDYQLASGYMDEPPPTAPRFLMSARGYLQGKGHLPSNEQQSKRAYDQQAPLRGQRMDAYGQQPPRRQDQGGHGYGQMPLRPGQDHGGYGYGQQPPRGQDRGGHGYGQMGGYSQMDPWGRPMHPEQMAGYGQPYGPDPYRQGERRGYQEPEPRSRQSMGNGNMRTPAPDSVDHHRRIRGHVSENSTPDIPLSRLRAQDPPSQAPLRVPSTPTMTIKAEPQDEPSMGERRGGNGVAYEAPMNPDVSMDAGAEEGSDDDEYTKLELAQLQNEARQNKLRLRLLDSQRKKKIGASPSNPMSLE